jgi:hypothetical protein
MRLQYKNGYPRVTFKLRCPDCGGPTMRLKGHGGRRTALSYHPAPDEYVCLVRYVGRLSDGGPLVEELNDRQRREVEGRTHEGPYRRYCERELVS